MSFFNWKNISPTEFEELCYRLLEVNGFKNLEWHGKGGNDRGRDIICTKSLELMPNKVRNYKWLCQCKRYVDSKMSKNELAESLHAAREHDIDFFLLAITETLQSSFRDWIDSIRGDYRFEIIIWDDLELRREVRSHFSVIADQFSALVKQKNVVNFYEVADSGKSYFCNEVDEVGFYIMNDYGREGNIKWIKEFIAFIRENEISF